MRESLISIQTRLRSGDYKNEEHVRLSLVGMLVQSLGWDLWNPLEVNTEFIAIPHEDKTRVDMALFLQPWSVPSVFIEIKAVGRLLQYLPDVEKQMRDYNRNNTAPISIITDGQHWKFYLSQTAGEFSQKCFQTFDLLDATRSIDDTQKIFEDFLAKEEIRNENAISKALQLLKRTQKEKLMYDLLPLAKRDAELDPSKRVADFFVIRLRENGIVISIEESIEFIKTNKHFPPVSPLPTRPSVASPDPRHPPVTDRKLHLTGSNCDAYGYILGDGFLALKGSRAVMQIHASLKGGGRKLRNDLLTKGIFTEVGKSIELTQDYKFNSPSQAASIFLGRSANGIIEWQ